MGKNVEVTVHVHAVIISMEIKVKYIKLRC